MTSPALAVSAGYRFSRPLALRVGVGGYEGKGYVMRTKEYYRYNYIRPTVDLIWHPLQFRGDIYNIYP